MDSALNPIQMEDLLQGAQKAYKQALEYQRIGDQEGSKNALIEAASLLEKAAGSSRGDLQHSRLQLASKLREEAEVISRQPVSVVGGTPRRTSTRGAADDEPQQNETWLVQERPNIRFDDIAGLEDVKAQIRLKLLYPFQHPELAKTYGINPGGGILLYGPPGTGKTMIAKAVAGEIDAAFFAIKPSEIMSQWVGVAEQNIQELFAMADSFPVSVLFIDEMDALAPKRRHSNSTVMQRVVPQLLAEMDGFEKRNNTLLMIGATNEPWSIDSAILRPGRLDRLIYVGPPDRNAREKILQINLEGLPLAGNVSLTALAEQTEGFSGADMTALARRVAESAFFDAILSNSERQISMEDFNSQLSSMRSSIDIKDLALFEKFISAM